MRGFFYSLLVTALTTMAGCGVEAESNLGDATNSLEEDVGFTRQAAEIVPSPTWECDWSSAQGKQYKTCAGGSGCDGRHANVDEHCPEGKLFFCDENSQALKEMCENGCVGHPVGTDDECK